MFIYTYVYIVQKLASAPIPRPCHAHNVDTSPAFHQNHAEEIREHTQDGLASILGHTQDGLASILGHTQDGLASILGHTQDGLASILEHTQHFALSCLMESGSSIIFKIFHLFEF